MKMEQRTAKGQLQGVTYRRVAKGKGFINLVSRFFAARLAEFGISAMRGGVPVTVTRK
jgi:hypothetical protein